MHDPPPGSCVGFGIRSDLPFRMLRDGGGPPLTVERYTGPEPRGEEVVTWQPRDGHPFYGRLLRVEGGFAFWANDVGWFLIDPTTPKISVECPEAESDEAAVIRELRLFGVPASICSMVRGTVAIHASAVEIDGKAVLFAGPSMYGKTTLAAALSARGHRLLSEDTARCEADPEPMIHPGPAVVRLRPDVAHHLRVPDTTELRMPDGRVSLVYDVNRRGGGAPVRIGSIVILRQGPGVELVPIDPHDAARDLFAVTFRLPSAEQRAAAFTRIVDLVGRVPVLDLRRPLGLDSIAEVASRVEATLIAS
jgi:hypothetical protein